MCTAPCDVSHKKTPQSGVFFRHPGKIPGEQPAITWQQMRQQQELEQRQQERQMRQQQERQQQELERQEQQLLLFCRKRTKQQQR